MIPPTPTTLTTMPGSKAKIGFSIDSIVGEEVSKSTTTTTTKDRNDFKYVNDYQTEIARALRLSDPTDGHLKFRSDLNGSNKEARQLFECYSMKRESSLSPSAPYTTRTTALPSEESSMRKSRTPSPNQAATVLTNNNNTSSNNNNNLQSSGSNTNNNEPPVVPSLAFMVSLTDHFILIFQLFIDIVMNALPNFMD